MLLRIFAYLFVAVLAGSFAIGFAVSPYVDATDEAAGCVVNLGVVFSTKSSMLAYNFDVHNVSATPLHIKGVKPSCGCSTAELSRADLPPGAHAVLHLEVNTKGAAQGYHEVQCALLQDEAPPLVYSLNFTLYHPLHLENPGHFNLGTLDSKNRIERVLRVRTYGTSVNSLPRIVSVEPGPTVRESLSPTIARSEPVLATLDDGVISATTDVQIGCVAGGKTTYNTDVIRITAEGPHISVVETVPITWETASDICVSPRRLYFGNVSRHGQPIKRSLELAHLHQRPFSITDVHTDDAFVTWNYSPAPSATQVLIVTLDPAKVREPFSIAMTIQTDQGVVNVPIAGVLSDHAFSPPSLQD